MLLLLALLSTCLLEKSDRWGPDGALPLRAEVVASGLVVPWSFAFLDRAAKGRSAGDVLVSERPGRVRLLREGKLAEQPVLEVEVASTSEGGLLGIAVNPKDPAQLFVYVTKGRFWPHNEVQRWRLSPDHARATFEKVLVDDIAAAAVHDGGRMRFGPDGQLYVGTGDARSPERAQDPRSHNGKLLRVGLDGGAAVVLSGIRNTQGFDWLDDQTLLVVDHGPSGELGRYAHDEVNVAREGQNLGWPDIFGCQEKAGMVTPLLTWSAHSLPPGGVVFVRGGPIAALNGSVLLASLAGEQLHRVVLSDDRASVKLHEVYFRQKFGRLREIAATPSGEIWFSTSNCDGRGECPPAKDSILRIVPQ